MPWKDNDMQKNIYYRHKIENLIVINKIVTIYYLEHDKDFVFNGESHNFWELVYAVKNEVICTGDNNVYHLKQGDIVFHKPNEFHTLRGNGKDPFVVFVLTFECKSEAIWFFKNKHISLSEANLYHMNSIITEARNTFKMSIENDIISRLDVYNNANLGGQQMLRTHLEQMLITIMREQSSNKDAREKFISREVLLGNLTKSVIAYLKENIYNKINFKMICSNLNYSKTYLCTEFKKKTGMTIFAYFMKLKIDEAKKLIIEKNHSIKEISDMLDFDTPSYFTKTFKKHTGVTPGQYYASEIEKIKSDIKLEES